MNPIVADIVHYVESGDTPSSLEPAQSKMGRHELRRVCLKLLGWWRQALVLAAERSCIELSAKLLWSVDLRILIESTPGLDKLLQIDEDTCGFHPGIDRAEIAAIHAYVRDHYRPTLSS